MSRYYQVINYVDVQQVSGDLWCVNQVAKTDLVVLIKDNTEAKDICKDLKREGILESANMRTLKISDLSKDIVEIKEKKSGKPLCRLESRGGAF